MANVKNFRQVLIAGAVFTFSASMPILAFATEASDTGAPAATDDGKLSEILVTAQRTSESLQKVPIAVTAVSAADLAERQLVSSGSLEAAVPNLTLAQTAVSINPFLRGVGSNLGDPNDEASVATYIDGVYIPSIIGNVFNFNNIERIEVLKGPQGTLFGRNATGGVIQIVTRDPQQEPMAKVSVGYGSYDTLESSAYVTGGLSKEVAVDLAAIFDQDSGYGRDIHRNTNILENQQVAFRSKLLWTPGDSTEVRVTGDFSKLISTSPDFQLAQGVIGVDGVTTYPGRRLTDTDYPNGNSNNIYGASIRVDQDFEVVRFASISAYRHVLGNFSLDQDATPLPLVQATIHQYAQTFSQELQLLSPKASAIEWLLGGFFFDAKYAYDPLELQGLSVAPLPQVDLFGDQKTKSGSVYGQATMPLFDSTKLTTGLRYTEEHQDTNGYSASGSTVFPHAPIALCPDQTTNCPQSQSFNKFTWRLALDHEFTSDILGYVSYNRGIKSGGFNMIDAGTPGYKPEVLDAYELGLKTQFFDERMRLNVAAFHYNYQEIQVFTIFGAGTVLTTNAAKARINGLDADLTIKPSANFTIASGLGLLSTKYTDFPDATFTPASPLDGPATTGSATGNRLIYAPKFNGNLSLNYRFPGYFGGNIDVNGNVAYRSLVYVSADNRLDIPAYAVVNAMIAWTSSNERVGVNVWARNLMNKDYYQVREEQSLGDLQYLAPPRTVGITVNYKTQ